MTTNNVVGGYWGGTPVSGVYSWGGTSVTELIGVYLFVLGRCSLGSWDVPGGELLSLGDIGRK